tara:strand:+ start:209 stop:376 length:168 start_codon:yes stop_codon:yes gene_type:complete
MAGKGDRYRQVDQEKWDKGWAQAFGKDKKEANQQEIDQHLMEKMNQRMKEEDLND